MRLFKRKKNPLAADMVLDKPEIKVVSAQYGRKPFFVAIGTAKGKAKEIEGGISIPAMSGKGGYDSKTEYDWKIIYHRKSRPDWFPPEQFSLLATNATTAVSGSINARNAKMIPISGKEAFDVKVEGNRILSVGHEGIHLYGDKGKKKRTRRT